MAARAEVTAAIRERYRASGKAAKSGILDEFVAVTRVHRKQAIRLLSEGKRPPAARPPRHTRGGRALARGSPLGRQGRLAHVDQRGIRSRAD